MTFTNAQIAEIRSIALMTEPYFIMEDGIPRQASYEDARMDASEDTYYHDRTEWLSRTMVEVRKTTGIIAFANK